MRAVDFVAQTMKRRGQILWTFPGGTIAPLYDACQQAGVRVIVARSETGAGYAALGAAKATGQPQVVAVTSGPGVTNVVSAVADAYYDAVPIVFLTGQVGTSAVREMDRTQQRQRGFQQTPACEILRPITVHQYQPMEAWDLPSCFDAALHAAQSGDRDGPAVVDMPMDVQRGEVERYETREWTVEPPRGPQVGDVEKVVRRMKAARKPIIIAGAGCLGAADLLREFAARCQIRVVTSLPAVGVLPRDSVNWRGMLGHTGFAGANRAVHEADLILALGTRLDVRQTGTETHQFAPNACLVRVDTSPAELGNPRVRQDVAIEADCGEFLKSLLIRFDLPVYEALVTCEPKVQDVAAQIVTAISRAAPGDCIFTTGVGAHQQHAARWLSLNHPRRMFITSAGHGCMGAGLPMALGAALATGRKAIVIDGDGSFQMTLNELGTIAQYGLQDQIEIHILDNGAGGIVSQFARLQGWNPIETTWAAGNPRFEAIAAAYGLSVNVHPLTQEGVWPILEGGRAMDEMTCFAEG